MAPTSFFFHVNWNNQMGDIAQHGSLANIGKEMVDLDNKAYLGFHCTNKCPPLSTPEHVQDWPKLLSVNQKTNELPKSSNGIGVGPYVVSSNAPFVIYVNGSSENVATHNLQCADDFNLTVPCHHIFDINFR